MSDTMYRAVLRITYPAVPDSPLEFMRTERSTTTHMPPVDSLDAAHAVIGEAKRRAEAVRISGKRQQHWTVTAHVESTHVDWKRVDS